MDLVADVFDRGFMADDQGFGEIGRDAFPVFLGMLGLVHMSKDEMETEEVVRIDCKGKSTMQGKE